ncbi:hypothetical protein [Pseudomonas sp.]|uniref:hypothetical protein n=1 Tax=Pseudomonas sp. TaxID=306 RepID=UPI003FD752DC
MTAFYEFLGFVLPLAGMFIVGIGFWALGQWLRRKGYGNLLDRISVGFGKVQRMTGPVVNPLCDSLIGLGRGLSRIPMLGSKRNRAMWVELEQKTPPNQDK